MARWRHSRRSALKRVSRPIASVVGQRFLAAWLISRSALAAGPVDMKGTRRATEATSFSVPCVLQFFKPPESRIVEILPEIIIPRDDRPEAKDARGFYTSGVGMVDALEYQGPSYLAELSGVRSFRAAKPQFEVWSTENP
jgi:hypothetical protein